MKSEYCNSYNKLNLKTLNTDLKARYQQKIVIKSLEHHKLSNQLKVSSHKVKHSYVNPSKTQAIRKDNAKIEASAVSTLQSLNSSAHGQKRSKSKFSNITKESNSKLNKNSDIIIKINNINNVIQIKDELKTKGRTKNDFTKLSNKTNSFNYNSNLFQHIKTISHENTKSAFNHISPSSRKETTGGLKQNRNQIGKEKVADFCSKIDLIDVANCADVNQILDCSTILLGIGDDVAKFLPDCSKILKKSGLKYKEIIELLVQNYNLAINKIQKSEHTIKDFKKSNAQLLDLVEIVEIKNKDIKKLKDKINEIEYNSKKRAKPTDILSSFNNDDEILSTDRIRKNHNFADDLEGILFFDKVKTNHPKHESVNIPKLDLKQAKEIYEKMHEREDKARKQQLKAKSIKK